MKLKELKKILNKMTPVQLEQELLYNSDEMSMSGVCKAVKAKCNLYNNYEDDPCSLKTMKDLKELGYDKEEIEGCDLEIKKGQLVITF